MRRAARAAFLVVLAAVATGSVVSSGSTIGLTPPWDKLAHLGAYFLLAFLAALGWPRWRGVALVGLPLVGLALEAAQTLSPARTFSWTDALANAAGIGLAVAATAILTRWLGR